MIFSLLYFQGKLKMDLKFTLKIEVNKKKKEKRKEGKWSMIPLWYILKIFSWKCWFHFPEYCCAWVEWAKYICLSIIVVRFLNARSDIFIRFALISLLTFLSFIHWFIDLLFFLLFFPLFFCFVFQNILVIVTRRRQLRYSREE